MAGSERKSIPIGARIVNEDDVHRAHDFLVNRYPNQIRDAQTRSTRASNMIKHIKALAQKAYDGPVSRGEIEAASSEAYKQAIDEDAIAAGELAKLRSLKSAAELTIEIWRTQSATFRASKIT